MIFMKSKEIILKRFSPNLKDSICQYLFLDTKESYVIFLSTSTYCIMRSTCHHYLKKYVKHAVITHINDDVGTVKDHNLYTQIKVVSLDIFQ